MNLLYIGTLPPHNGGSAINAAQILEGFVSSGHIVHAIAPITPGSESAPGPAGVSLARYTMPSFEASPDQPAPESYREQQRNGIQSLFPNPLATFDKPPIVIIGRENFAPDVVGLARDHGLRSVLWAQGATTWGMKNGSLPESMTRTLLADFRKADRVVSVAHHMAETLNELGVDQVETVSNGVDVRRFQPGPRNPGLLEQLGIPDDHLVVLHVSNMKALKRPEDILDAADAVKSFRSKVTWVLVGDGPVLKEVREKCREMGLEQQFRFTGWLDHAAMPDMFRLADLVVMPSACEGLALVYLETMASGRVLLASDIPAAREVVKDGDNGLLFPLGNPERIAELVTGLTSDPGLRSRIGERAVETAHSHSMDNAVAGHLRVLEALNNPR